MGMLALLSAWECKVARAHASFHVMVSVDLLNGWVWQRCWDQMCVCMHGRLYVKARAWLGGVPQTLDVAATSVHAWFGGPGASGLVAATDGRGGV